LKEFSRLDGVTYGPVASRRFGASLGINVFPGQKKVCSFECPYCQLGFADPKESSQDRSAHLASAEEIGEGLSLAINRLLKTSGPVQSLTFSGNGEPTSHPQFPEIVKTVRAIRDQLVPKAEIVVLTNGAHLKRPGVIEALGLCDRAVVKLDAGTQEMFEKVDQPNKGIQLIDIVEECRKLRLVTIQTMFVAGSIDNTVDREIDAWVGHLKKIQPAELQIYTLDRNPADPSLRPVDRAILLKIGERVKKECTFTSRVFLPD
jgi:wyosine [tRNA(Phe)-imidazoG37] synthetase (radical SAM superfamily)